MKSTKDMSGTAQEGSPQSLRTIKEVTFVSIEDDPVYQITLLYIINSLPKEIRIVLYNDISLTAMPRVNLKELTYKEVIEKNIHPKTPKPRPDKTVINIARPDKINEHISNFNTEGFNHLKIKLERIIRDEIEVKNPNYTTPKNKAELMDGRVDLSLYNDHTQTKRKDLNALSRLDNNEELIEWSYDYFVEFLMNSVRFISPPISEALLDTQFFIRRNEYDNALITLKAMHLLWPGTRAELELFDTKYSRALSQAKFRRKKKNKVPLNTYISSESRTQLKKLAIRKKKTQYEVLEELIYHEFHSKKSK